MRPASARTPNVTPTPMPALAPEDRPEPLLEEEGEPSGADVPTVLLPLLVFVVLVWNVEADNNSEEAGGNTTEADNNAEEADNNAEEADATALDCAPVVAAVTVGAAAPPCVSKYTCTSVGRPANQAGKGVPTISDDITAAAEVGLVSASD